MINQYKHYTINQIAQFKLPLLKSRNSIQEEIQDGNLRAEKVPGRTGAYLVRGSDLIAFLERYYKLNLWKS